MSHRTRTIAVVGGLLTVGLAGGATASYAVTAAGDDSRAQALQAKQSTQMNRITGPGTTIGPRGTGVASVSCPAGTLLTGGGHSTSAFDIYTTDSFHSGNTWTVIAKNLSTTSSQTVRAVARCAGGS